MAHKTMINGTSYNVVGGTTMVDGTSRRVAAGRTLINGTGYDVPFVEKVQRLAFKGYRYPNGYKDAPNSASGFGTTKIYASDLGLEDFSRVESMRCNDIDYAWRGSWSSRWGWVYGLRTYSDYVNPYPTAQLSTVCFCDENRTTNVEGTGSSTYAYIRSGEDANGVYLNVDSTGSSDQYGGPHTPYLREVWVTYWGDFPETTPISDEPIIMNRTTEHIVDNYNVVWLSNIGLAPNSNRGWPCGIYRMHLTFVKDGVEQSVYVSPDLQHTYTDFWFNTTPKEDVFFNWYDSSRTGFQLINNPNESNPVIYPITKIVVYHSA